MHLSDRRHFLRNLVGGLAATSAVRTWPFRVYSFPTEIIQPKIYPLFDEISYTTLADLRDDILIDNFFVDAPWMSKLRQQGWDIRLPRMLHETS